MYTLNDTRVYEYSTFRPGVAKPNLIELKGNDKDLVQAL